ncbi:MAG: hypothetical protein WAV76_09375 [Bacteroidota bacterium]
MKNKFESGDIVSDKNHPDKMCVKKYDETGKVICTWFCSSKRLHEEPFDENELTLCNS